MPRTLWAICNIVSGTSAQTSVMVNLGAVSITTNILRDHSKPDSDVVEQGDGTMNDILLTFIAGLCISHVYCQEFQYASHL